MSSETTSVVLQTGPGRLEMAEVPIPIIGSDDALLRVDACGLCGTDLDQFHDPAHTRPYPLIPGHEPVGHICEIGSALSEEWEVGVGARVLVEPLRACLNCRNCRSGDARLCTRRASMDAGSYSTTPLMVAPGLWGGFAQHLFLTRGSAIHHVPESLPDHVAVMGNSMANAIEWTILTPGVTIGDRVLLLGCGQRSLLAVVALKSAGVRDVFVTGLRRDGPKLSMALELGATAAVDVETEDLREVLSSHGPLPDVAVDMTPGALQPVSEAVALTREGGVVVIAGLKRGHLAPVDTDLVIRKGLTIRSGLSASYRAFELAVDMLASNVLILETLNSGILPFQEAGVGLAALEGGNSQTPVVSVSLTMTGNSRGGLTSG